MAILNVIDNEAELTVRIENGDLQALNEIKEGWKFSNKENALRFGLAILKKALSGGKKIYIDEGGEKITLTPSENLLESNLQESSE